MALETEAEMDAEMEMEMRCLIGNMWHRYHSPQGFQQKDEIRMKMKVKSN
jgi:hypothetical protein